MKHKLTYSDKGEFPMRLEQLYYVIEIAKTHSFSIAAENLFIGQSTLSETIKKLEEELSVALFIRSKNGVYLTAVGKEILEIALQVTRLTEQIKTVAQQSAQPDDSDIKGELDISVSIGIIQEYLQHTLPHFQIKYPHVALNIVERGFYALLDLIQNQQSDLGITITNQTDYWLDQTTSLKYKCLGTESFYLLASSDSPLAQKNTVAIHDLIQYPLATLGYNDLSETSHIHPLNDMLIDKAQFQIVFTTNNTQLFINYLLQNKEVVGFPLTQLTLSTFPKTLQLTAVKISDTFKAKIYYLYRPDNPKLPLIEAFLGILQKNIL